MNLTEGLPDLATFEAQLQEAAKDENADDPISRVVALRLSRRGADPRYYEVAARFAGISGLNWLARSVIEAGSATAERLAILDLLFKHGLDANDSFHPDQEFIGPRTLLGVASREGYMSYFPWLLAHGAHLSNENHEALRFAGSGRVISRLLQLGVDPAAVGVHDSHRTLRNMTTGEWSWNLLRLPSGVIGRMLHIPKPSVLRIQAQARNALERALPTNLVRYVWAAI